MSRCLSERELFLLFDGAAASRAPQGHLAQCAGCASRYRQLQDDLKALSQTLKQPAPEPAAHEALRPWSFRWLPAAVALALVLVLAWSGGRLWTRPESDSLQGFSRGDLWSLMEDFSAEFAFLTEAKAEEIWSEVGGFDDWLSGLEEDGFLARNEMTELELAAELPCPLCVERNRSAPSSPPKPSVPKYFPEYKMEVF